MTTVYNKDPASTGQYALDWSNYLPPGGTIATSTWELHEDLTEISNAKTGNTTTIVIGGGELDFEYEIYNTVTSDGGLIGRRGFVLRVVDALEIHETSDLEKQLAALRVAIGAKAASDTQEYQIANRLKRRYTFADLLEWEKRLSALVNQERAASGGSGFFKNHFVRPTEPGP